LKAKSLYDFFFFSSKEPIPPSADRCRKLTNLHLL